jgi:hypothetical protein
MEQCITEEIRVIIGAARKIVLTSLGTFTFTVEVLILTFQTGLAVDPCAVLQNNLSMSIISVS